jgi:hypothetical protein
MPKICYVEKRFSSGSLEVIAKANRICAAYKEQDYDLTLRQLYYQFVSRDWIPNRDSEYKRLGSIINDARLAGLLDWNYIVDRTRNLRSLAHWDSPQELVSAAAKQYRIEKWSDQDYYVEVWVEKDALVGVLESACNPLDVPFFSCRGYTSQSEIWSAAQRLGEKISEGKLVRVIHLGDHDPSGIDMTRDIWDRLATFIAQDRMSAPSAPAQELSSYIESYREDVEDALRIDRIALNWDQIQRYAPPPNPAKLSDSRATGYIDKYGYESWELDALEPTVLVGLIQDAVAGYRDNDLWEQAVEREESEREALTAAAERWEDVVNFLGEKE